jgi:hypothetical protein
LRPSTPAAIASIAIQASIVAVFFMPGKFNKFSQEEVFYMV